MTRKIKIILVGSLATLLLAFIYWQPQIKPVNEAAKTMSDADYYFETVSLKQFNQKGQLASELTAEKMEHFNSSDSSRFISPKIRFLSEQNSAWQITSKIGELNHQASELVLEDNAVIRQVDVENQLNNSNQLKTHKLTIDLARKHAMTDSKVTIETESSQTQAIGMQADFDKETIQLLGQVETRGISNDSQK